MKFCGGVTSFVSTPPNCNQLLGRKVTFLLVSIVLGLATFISPRYLDCPFEKMSYEEFKVKNPNFVNEWPKPDKVYCAACGTLSASLKCCPRCRSTYYCDVKCQKTHWDQHKANAVISKIHSQFSFFRSFRI